jgi:hypothetical protein
MIKVWVFMSCLLYFMVYFIVHMLFEPYLSNIVDVYMNMKYLFW